MPFPKSVKIAAIVSQVLIVLWVILNLLANLFQNDLLTLYMDSGYVIENTDKITTWAVIVRCIAAIVISVANVLICRRKTVHTPLVMTAVTAGVIPFAVRYVYIRQSLIVSMEGVNEFARLGVVNQIESTLAYFLSAAMIITIAAGAVYAFAKNNCSESEDFSEKE